MSWELGRIYKNVDGVTPLPNIVMGRQLGQILPVNKVSTNKEWGGKNFLKTKATRIIPYLLKEFDSLNDNNDAFVYECYFEPEK